MAEVGNAPASGVAVDPGTERNGGGAAAPTDAGGQAAVGGGGPSQIGNKTNTATRSYETTRGRLIDGTEWEETVDDEGVKVRTETTTDGRGHRTTTDASGNVVDETYTDADGSGRQVETLPDGTTRTTRTWSDGSKDVTRTYGDYEMENRYSPEGEHVQDVRRDAEQTTVHDLKDGQLGRSTSFPTLGSAESVPPTPPAPPGPTAQRPAAPASPASPAASPSFRPPAGGGMSQVDMGDVEPQLPPDPPAEAEPPRPAPRGPSLGGGMSQIEDLGESSGTASP